MWVNPLVSPWLWSSKQGVFFSFFPQQVCDCFLMADKQQPFGAVYHSEVAFSIAQGKGNFIVDLFWMKPSAQGQHG